MVTPRRGRPPKTTRDLSQVRVNAMMITGKCPERRHMAYVAAECFNRQTHPNRKLVIVNHGDEPLRVRVRTNPGDVYVGCDEVMTTREECPTLGDLRNKALDLCLDRGLVCIWDDDDWTADTYMATLAAAHVPDHVVLMRYQIRHDLDTDTSYVHKNVPGHYGQVLYASTSRQRYPKLDKHEDADFVRQFSTRLVVLVNDPKLYVRTCHAHNTWHQRHIMGSLAGRRDVHMLTKDQLELVRHVRTLYGRENPA